MATKQICLNWTDVLVVISRICCSFGDSQSRFWMQLCVLVENQCERMGSVVPVSCSGLSLRVPLCELILCVPFCPMRKLLMKMLFCSSCLRVRHCLWEAFSRCDKMVGLGNEFLAHFRPVLTNWGLVTSPGSTGYHNCLNDRELSHLWQDYYIQ